MKPKPTTGYQSNPVEVLDEPIIWKQLDCFWCFGTKHAKPCRHFDRPSVTQDVGESRSMLNLRRCLVLRIGVGRRSDTTLEGMHLCSTVVILRQAPRMKLGFRSPNGHGCAWWRSEANIPARAGIEKYRNMFNLHQHSPMFRCRAPHARKHQIGSCHTRVLPNSAYLRFPICRNPWETICLSLATFKYVLQINFVFLTLWETHYLDIAVE